jgi:hypothetical protein
VTDGDSRTNRWRETWYRRLDAAALRPDLDRLALVVASRSRADGTRAVAGHRWLANRLDWSESTVKRRLAELASSGWVERTESGRRRGDGTVTANVYRLLIPPGSTGQGAGERDPLRTHLNRSGEGPQQVSETASTGQSPACRDLPPRESPPRSSGAASTPTDRPLPADWTPSVAAQAKARLIGADLAAEVAEFGYKAEVKGWLRRDWDAAFLAWLDYAEPAPPPVVNVHADQARDWTTPEAQAEQAAYLATLGPPKTDPFA